MLLRWKPNRANSKLKKEWFTEWDLGVNRQMYGNTWFDFYKEPGLFLHSRFFVFVCADDYPGGTPVRSAATGALWRNSRETRNTHAPKWITEFKNHPKWDRHASGPGMFNPIHIDLEIDSFSEGSAQEEANKTKCVGKEFTMYISTSQFQYSIYSFFQIAPIVLLQM